MILDLTKDLNLVKTAIALMIDNVDVKTFTKYLYAYLQEHPNQVKKVYALLKAGELLIEQAFKDRLNE